MLKKKLPVGDRQLADIILFDKNQTNALILRVSFDFRLAALFLWITDNLAILSIMEIMTGSFSVASLLSSRSLNFLIALRMVFP